MAAILREGSLGKYYGNTYETSNALDETQMKFNVTYIYNYLSIRGWTKNAIAGLVGNMQAESSINPGRWQSDDVGNMEMGYSLVQWTSASKYIGWVSGDPSEMDNALSRIIYEVENKIQWYGTGDFANMSFEDFTKSEEPPSTLAKAFLLCYERPADQSESVQNYRGSLADNWYTYLAGEEPPSPGDDSSKKKKKKFNFILFKRRRVYG